MSKKTSFPPNFNNKTTSVARKYATRTNLITSLKIGCDYVLYQYKILPTNRCGTTPPYFRNKNNNKMR
jgi:hypothetical protein